MFAAHLDCTEWTEYMEAMLQVSQHILLLAYFFHFVIVQAHSNHMKYSTQQSHSQALVKGGIKNTWTFLGIWNIDAHDANTLYSGTRPKPRYMYM